MNCTTAARHHRAPPSDVATQAYSVDDTSTDEIIDTRSEPPGFSCHHRGRREEEEAEKKRRRRMIANGRMSTSSTSSTTTARGNMSSLEAKLSKLDSRQRQQQQQGQREPRDDGGAPAPTSARGGSRGDSSATTTKKKKSSSSSSSSSSNGSRRSYGVGGGGGGGRASSSSSSSKKEEEEEGLVVEVSNSPSSPVSLALVPVPATTTTSTTTDVPRRGDPRGHSSSSSSSSSSRGPTVGRSVVVPSDPPDEEDEYDNRRRRSRPSDPPSTCFGSSSRHSVDGSSDDDDGSDRRSGGRDESRLTVWGGEEKGDDDDDHDARRFEEEENDEVEEKDYGDDDYGEEADGSGSREIVVRGEGCSNLSSASTRSRSTGTKSSSSSSSSSSCDPSGRSEIHSLNSAVERALVVRDGDDDDSGGGGSRAETGDDKEEDEDYEDDDADDDGEEDEDLGGSREIVVRESGDLVKADGNRFLAAAVDNYNAMVPVDSAIYEAYDHTFVTCPESLRFRFLYTFLKKNLDKKVMIFFSTTNSVRYHAALLDMFRVPVLTMHGNQRRETFVNRFFRFSDMDEGILCTTDAAGRDLDIPPSVDWVVQFEPPDDPSEYILRVARISCDSDRVGRSLLFLNPGEKQGFLKYYHSASIPVSEFELPANLVDVQSHIERAAYGSERFVRRARDAFGSYLMAYASHGFRDVYNVHDLDKGEVAEAFGLVGELAPRNDDNGDDDLTVAEMGTVMTTSEVGHGRIEFRTSKSATRGKKKEKSKTWMKGEKSWPHSQIKLHPTFKGSGSAGYY